MIKCQHLSRINSILSLVEHEKSFYNLGVLFSCQGWKGKSKSSHDLANDPKLSAVPALEMEEELSQPEKRELETQVGFFFLKM